MLPSTTLTYIFCIPPFPTNSAPNTGGDTYENSRLVSSERVSFHPTTERRSVSLSLSLSSSRFSPRRLAEEKAPVRCF